MIKVLIDACGWKAVIDAGINIDKSLLETVGTTQLVLIPNVVRELEALGGNLMLDMLLSKSEEIPAPDGIGNHTDDQLLELAKLNNWPILTVDTELKRRISQLNLNWIEVVGNKHLRLI